MASLRVATVNVRGIKDKRKRLTLIEWIIKNDIDITLLQETYCNDNVYQLLSSEWNGEIYYSKTDSNHSRGVAIFLSNKICKRQDYNFVNYVCDEKGRRVSVNFMLHKQLYSIVNMYCPNDEKSRQIFLEESSKCILGNMNSENLIVGGDFNSVTDEIDKVSKVSNKNRRPWVPPLRQISYI